LETARPGDGVEEPAAVAGGSFLAHAGGRLQQALVRLGTWTFEIVRRSDTAKGFEPLPRRRVVARTLAWLNRNRRLARA